MPHAQTRTFASRSVSAMLQTESDLLRDLLARSRYVLDSDLIRRLDRALDAAASPTCAEAQADGVPCESTDRACDQCAHALERIRALRKALEAEAAGRSSADLRALLRREEWLP